MSIPPIKIGPTDTKSLLFRVKKFDYNSYFIKHQQVEGVLRIANIPTDIMLIPDDKFPPNVDVLEEQKYIMGYHSIVAFTNHKDKNEPSELPKSSELKKRRKMELTNYMIQERTFEPWNEYVIQGSNPKLLKTRTILAKIEWYPDITNRLGDPYIWANHNTTFSVSSTDIPESGLT